MVKDIFKSLNSIHKDSNLTLEEYHFLFLLIFDFKKEYELLPRIRGKLIIFPRLRLLLGLNKSLYLFSLFKIISLSILPAKDPFVIPQVL